MKFMAQRRGKTTDIFDTAQAAREDWHAKYPREKFCSVFEGIEGPNGTFIRPWNARMWCDVPKTAEPLGE